MARTTSVNYMLRADGEGEGVLDRQFIYAHYIRMQCNVMGIYTVFLPQLFFLSPFLHFVTCPFQIR